MNLLTFVALLAAAVFRGGLCIARFSPESESEIIHLTGTPNVTFECFITDGNGSQTLIMWNVENFRDETGARDILTHVEGTSLTGDSTNGTELFPTFRTRLTISSWLKDFDEAIITCGNADDLRAGLFFLRIYREPTLQTLPTPVRFVEGESNLTVNLETGVPAFPFPSSFQWSLNGRQLQNDSRRSLGYPEATFSDVRRSDAGLYALMATNFFVDDPSREVASGEGEFTLDVLYGPDVMRTGEPRAVAVNGTVTLQCGNNVMSNPAPTVVTWSGPSYGGSGGGGGGDRFSVGVVDGNGGVVELTIAEAVAEDAGEWTCVVEVVGTNVTRSASDNEGGVSPMQFVGNFSNSVNLTVLVAPGRPLNLSTDDFSASWVYLCWQAPLEVGTPGIAYYEVTATPVTNGDTAAGTMVVPTASSITRLNVTGLAPNVEYEFRVRGVAAALGAVSPGALSEPVSAVTLPTVPSLTCQPLQEVNGMLRISWSFEHDGGTPIASLSVNYTITKSPGGPPMSLPAPSVQTEATSVDVSSLVAGYLYGASVEAVNMMGPTRVQCDTLRLEAGIPQAPASLMLQEVGMGRVEVSVSTPVAGTPSGTSNSPFTFIIFYTDTGHGDDAAVAMETRSHGDEGATSPAAVMMSRLDVPGYTDGQGVVVTIEGLTEGSVYSFVAQAMNDFGRSENSSAASILVTRAEVTPGSSSAAGAIAGGVIGGLLGVILVAIIIVIVVFILVKGSRGHSYKVEKAKSPSVKYTQAPSTVKVEELPESSPDIGSEIEVVVAADDKKELHYAELDTIRPSTTSPKQVSSPETTHKPQLEPVQYAVIDTFKKPIEEPSDDKTGTPTTMV